ncbi:MAG TPA: 50S ribosomal protein L1 [Thermoplasmatales archaeon]|nr:MAG: 50S ribosomal protein L1 [Thermoplasmata archaeon]HDM25454.1 50S ribosomal protein L1 [Thermoplasmatales archaeon]
MNEKDIVKIIQKILDEKHNKKRKFKQSIDLVINIKGVDFSDPKNRIEEEILLPNGRGKDAKIALFASGELAVKAKGTADLIIKPEEIEDLAKDKKNFKKIAEKHDFFIAEAPLMPVIGKSLGVILGPRGKMPKPVPPTVDIENLVKNLRKTIKIRSKGKKTFHAVVGTEDMNPEKIAKNITTVIKRLEEKLPNGRLNIESMYIKTSMGSAEKLM